ncbi:ABC transporter substrate-binding protein [Paenibacillus glycanilyticus]|uniref:ABC transporter substrate-binding protein n=1 Tax=Paenibacillus glycanilyticus TaxID=126569 RepID=A0ABQ6GBG6_9BACL|nr:ABC transporter substrate-binding protein [Paenibacillus glycanilyticus]GLX66936.1 ABC transporter substrate-binding protein [Paenibacillus glycanilyticus]
MKSIMLYVLLSVSLMLSGCSSDSDPAPAPTAAVTESNTNSAPAFPRTITDAKGEQIIPIAPQKIALTAWGFIDMLLTLEPQQLATTGYSYYSKLDAFKASFASESFVDLGSDTQINMEKLLEYKPDIILAGGTDNDAVYSQLTKIAPVVFIDAAKGYEDWKWALTEYAKALGLEDKAKQVIEDHEAKLHSAKNKLEKYKDQNVIFLDPSEGEFYLWGTDRLSTYYDVLGLKMVDTELAASGGQITLEGLLELNPDHIFLHNRPTAPAAEALEALSKSKVWNMLDAVKNGHVYTLESSAFSPGPTGVGYGVDHILEALN